MKRCRPFQGLREGISGRVPHAETPEEGMSFWGGRTEGRTVAVGTERAKECLVIRFIHPHLFLALTKGHTVFQILKVWKWTTLTKSFPTWSWASSGVSGGIWEEDEARSSGLGFLHHNTSLNILPSDCDSTTALRDKWRQAVKVKGSTWQH